VWSFLEARGLLDLVLGDELRPDNTPTAPTASSSQRMGRSGIQAQLSPADTVDARVPELSLYEAWRRKNVSARSYIMGYCSLTMRNKIIDLPTVSEQWEALRKDCRLLNDILLATYTS
jgi:hypothetical protein